MALTVYCRRTTMILTDGIGLEGLASEIGALGRKSLAVERKTLVRGLCRRFGTTTEEAENAISRARDLGAVKESGNVVRLLAR
jgi:hypothetical protein